MKERKVYDFDIVTVEILNKTLKRLFTCFLGWVSAFTFSLQSIFFAVIHLFCS